MKKILMTLSFLFLIGCFFSQTSIAASLKPIQLHPDYNNTKYAPECTNNDILRQFRAYTTCFDGADDDDGDGTADKWAIPQWVAYEIKRCPET
jgi:hypothetical protein